MSNNYRKLSGDEEQKYETYSNPHNIKQGNTINLGYYISQNSKTRTKCKILKTPDNHDDNFKLFVLDGEFKGSFFTGQIKAKTEGLVFESKFYDFDFDKLDLNTGEFLYGYWDGDAFNGIKAAGCKYLTSDDVNFKNGIINFLSCSFCYDGKVIGKKAFCGSDVNDASYNIVGSVDDLVLNFEIKSSQNALYDRAAITMNLSSSKDKDRFITENCYNGGFLSSKNITSSKNGGVSLFTEEKIYKKDIRKQMNLLKELKQQPKALNVGNFYHTTDNNNKSNSVISVDIQESDGKRPKTKSFDNVDKTEWQNTVNTKKHLSNNKSYQ